MLKALIESPSDDITDSLSVSVNIEEYAPFKALDIDQVHAFSLAGQAYLIVTLSNGYVLCFNLYLNAFRASTQTSIA